MPKKVISELPKAFVESEGTRVSDFLFSCQQNSLLFIQKNFSISDWLKSHA